MPLPEGYKRVRKTFTQPSRTRQSEAEETDINKIVARHAKTGVVSHLTNKPAQYGDLSQAVELKTALDLTLSAQDGFMDLPASVRRAADNDPRKMLELLSSEAGTELLVDAGLDLPLLRDPAPSKLAFEPPSDGKSVAKTEGETPPKPSPVAVPPPQSGD